MRLRHPRSILLPTLAFLCLLLTGCSVLFCKEEEVYVNFTIKLQDGRYGKKFPKKTIDMVTLLMVQCDSLKASQIQSFPYDSANGVNLGTLNLFLKGKLVFQKAMHFRHYAANGSTHIGIANTGYDTLKVDSLEIVNASELLNGLEAEFIQFNKCMCWRNPASDLKFVSQTTHFSQPFLQPYFPLFPQRVSHPFSKTCPPNAQRFRIFSPTQASLSPKPRLRGLHQAA